MDYSYWEWVGPQDELNAAVDMHEADSEVFNAKLAAIQKATAAYLPEGVKWLPRKYIVQRGSILGGGYDTLAGLLVRPSHLKAMLAAYDKKVWAEHRAGENTAFEPRWNRKPGTTIRKQWNDTRMESLQHRLLKAVGLCDEVIIHGNRMVAPVVGGKKQDDGTWRLGYRVPIGDSGSWKSKDDTLLAEITYTRFMDVTEL